MNILYIHQYFATPSGKTGTRSYEFARRWVKQGHSVKMLTTTAQLTPATLAKAQGLFVKKFVVDGIEVSAISIPYRQKMGIVKRCTAFAAFTAAASLFTIFSRNYDVIYATSTPLTVGIPALFAKQLRRKKFVFEVRDQWPQIPIQMEIIKNRLLIALLLKLEKTIYKNASAIIALSPGMAEGIKEVQGSSPNKHITVIPNSCDIDVFRPDIDGLSVRKERGWENRFVLLHAGAMGKTNGLDFVVNVAEKLRNYDDLLFVLAGEGGEKKTLTERIVQLGLKNVAILDAVPKKNLPMLMASSDVAIVIFANYPILEHNSANKFFDSLSAGKPVLLNYSGWQRKLLEENQAGFGCTLYDIDEFVQKVLYLYKNREKLAVLGRNARRIATELFDRDVLAGRALAVIEISGKKDNQ